MTDDADAPGAEPSPADDLGDKFYRGTVVRLHRGAEGGTIRSAAGRLLPFVFQHVTMLGPHQRFQDLREGLQVGYDVSWTSRGLRVSVIRIPD